MIPSTSCHYLCQYDNIGKLTNMELFSSRNAQLLIMYTWNNQLRRITSSQGMIFWFKDIDITFIFLQLSMPNFVLDQYGSYPTSSKRVFLKAWKILCSRDIKSNVNKFIWGNIFHFHPII